MDYFSTNKMNIVIEEQGRYKEDWTEMIAVMSSGMRQKLYLQKILYFVFIFVFMVLEFA